MLACLDLEQKNQEEGDVGEKEMEVALKRSSGSLCAPTEVLSWSERECACIRACISACCMLLLAVNSFCGVCVSAALLAQWSRKKIRWGAAPPTEREYEKDV